MGYHECKMMTNNKDVKLATREIYVALLSIHVIVVSLELNDVVVC